MLDQATTDLLQERSRFVAHDAEMTRVKNRFASAESIRKSIPKDQRTEEQQRQLDLYAGAREKAGARCFPKRPWARLYHLKPRLTREQVRELVGRAQSTFNVSKRVADRRWQEYKRLTADDLECLQGLHLLDLIREIDRADAN